MFDIKYLILTIIKYYLHSKNFLEILLNGYIECGAKCVQNLYINIALKRGFPQQRIKFLQVLPNMLGPRIVIATANFDFVFLLEMG